MERPDRRMYDEFFGPKHDMVCNIFSRFLSNSIRILGQHCQIMGRRVWTMCENFSRTWRRSNIFSIFHVNGRHGQTVELPKFSLPSAKLGTKILKNGRHGQTVELPKFSLPSAKLGTKIKKLLKIKINNFCRMKLFENNIS